MNDKQPLSMPLEVQPFDAPLGAEIRGLDLRETFSAATLEAVRDAWHEHLVLLFRDQDLSDAQHFAFTASFGPLEHAPDKLLKLAQSQVQSEAQRQVNSSNASPPEMTVISNVIENGVAIGRLGNGEALWHTDSNFAEIPPAGSILRALEVPQTGGDTAFMNMYEALDSLPSELRAAIDGRFAKHNPGYDSSGKRRAEFQHNGHPAAGPGPIHPLIRIHPGSGRSALYLGRRAGAWIVDADVAHSEQLLDAIWAHIESQSFTCTHTWRVGDVLMWDNRCTMHRREAFDGDSRRIMHRTQLAGDQSHGAFAQRVCG